MKKLHHLLPCVLLFFTLLHHRAIAQGPVPPQYTAVVAAADNITRTCVQATSDANYIANHAGGGGNAQQMTARINNLSQAVNNIVADAQSVFGLAAITGIEGMVEEGSHIREGALALQSTFITIQQARELGLPIPQGAAIQAQGILFALRQASPCIRREIQEID